MTYPEQLNFFNSMPLYIPDPEQVKATYELLRAADPQTPFPFWAQIWPSAKAMAAYVEKNSHWVQHKSVLELGAGMGLPSFTIAHFTQSVLVSDYNEEAVAYMKKNIETFIYSNMQAQCLDWNHLPSDLHAEVLLLSDINYAPDDFPVLLQMIHRFINAGSTIILSTPQRITITPFAAALQSYIKESTLIQVEHLQQMIDIRILILSQ